MERFLASVIVVDAPSRPIRVCRDPDDDAILALAVAGGADPIVTAVSLAPGVGSSAARYDEFRMDLRGKAFLGR